MANIATDARAVSVARAAFVGGFLLSLVICLQCEPPPPAFALVSLESVHRPPVIVPMELDVGPGWISRLVDALTLTVTPDVVAPPEHPDAQPWPRGMVIQPKPFADRMTVDVPGALDRALSALLSPWLTTAS
jgi:hypothetical protein